ncbi:hypothetical protein [Novosphingobium sp.]|uniref:hypothetical protein n=1 Tax=Novosphingobium sp. TaxID=1874826 RepID=UPI0025DF9B6F|nr:hypothetical protein [Novosphingobium sp.]
MASRFAIAGYGIAGGIVASMAPATAQAAERVQLASDVFVERYVPGPDGRVSRVLERPAALHPGDRLIFVVNWKARAAGASRDFTVTNPMPRSVSYQRSIEADEEVSIDGGLSWGRLEDLRLRDEGRIRQATPEDVTHVRWRVPARMAVLGSGQITYRGVVR